MAWRCLTFITPQDAVELGIALRHAKEAAGSWNAVTSESLEATLRDFEIKRSPRCSMLVERARAVRRSLIGSPAQPEGPLKQAANVVCI